MVKRRVSNDNCSKMDFWLSLCGENIDLQKIEDTLKIKLQSNRIIPPTLHKDNVEYPIFYAEIAWLMDFVESEMEDLVNLGVCFSESAIWMIYSYEKQCNIEFDADLLQRIGKLGLKLCISCEEA